MSRFGFCGSTYTSESPNVAANRSVNWYPETVESGDGVSPIAMYPSPGEGHFMFPTPASTRPETLYYWPSPAQGYGFTGRLWAVCDTGQALLINSSAGVDVTLTGFATGTNPTQITSNTVGEVLFCSGGNLYLYPSAPIASYNITAVAYVQGAVGLPDTLVFTSASLFGYPVGSTVHFASISAATGLNGLSAQVVSGTGTTTLTTTVPEQFISSYFGSTSSTGSINSATQGQVAIISGTYFTHIGYCDGFFVALDINSGHVYYSSINDGSTWNVSSYFVVSQFADRPIALFVDHREIWVFGAKNTVVYYDSGDLLNPFQPIPGAFIEQGIAARYSTVKMDNSIFWIGADERGQGVAWRANGYVPVRVSNHAVENAWRQYSTISDAVAYSFQMNGHTFWHIWFPTANASWRYDAAVNQWHEVTWFNTANSSVNAHRSRSHAFVYGKHLVADTITPGVPTGGAIYEMNINFVTDYIVNWTTVLEATYSIQRVRQAPHITTEQEWMFHDQLQVYLESGLGPAVQTAPASILVQDSSGNYWNVGINNSGTVTTTSTTSGLLQGVVLNSGSNYFLVGVVSGSAVGLPVGNSGNAINQYALQTPNGNLSFLTVNSSGVLSGSTPTAFGLAPLASLQWSDDGGHTWSNSYTSSAGSVGQYRQRVIWRRLGRTRDRIYRLTCTDATSWRIVDAYLLAQPGFVPQPRISENLRKMA